MIVTKKLILLIVVTFVLGAWTCTRPFFYPKMVSLLPQRDSIYHTSDSLAFKVEFASYRYFKGRYTVGLSFSVFNNSPAMQHSINLNDYRLVSSKLNPELNISNPVGQNMKLKNVDTVLIPPNSNRNYVFIFESSKKISRKASDSLFQSDTLILYHINDNIGIPIVKLIGSL